MSRPRGQTLTRQDVVTAAVVCLQKDGEAGLGVNRVARELGIRPPSIYKHIKGNEALRLAVAAEGMRLLTEYLKHYAQDTNQQDCSIRTIAHAVRQFFHQNQALHQVMTTTIVDGSDPDFQAIKQAFLQFNVTALEPFKLSGDDFIHALRMFISMCHGFSLLEQSQQFKEPQSLDESYEWLISTFILGIRKRSEKSANNLQEIRV